MRTTSKRQTASAVISTGPSTARSAHRGRDRRTIITRLLAFVLSLLPVWAPAQDDPLTLVRATTGVLFERVQAERELLRADPDSLHPMIEQVLLPHVDLELTSRLVLGKHWRRATGPQRQWFMDEFRALLLRTYSTALIEFADIDVRYLDTRYTEDERAAVVRTRVHLSDGRPDVSIDYRMARGDVGWRVFDVLVGGVSLVTTYRASFGDEIARGGLDGLLRSMRSRSTPKDRDA